MGHKPQEFTVIEVNKPRPDIGEIMKRWQIEVVKRAIADGRLSGEKRTTASN